MQLDREVVSAIVKNMNNADVRALFNAVSESSKWRIASFDPHRKQSEFFASPAPIRLFQGGNRSGKTTAGVLEDVAHVLGYRPWLSRSDPMYKVNVRIPSHGRIVVPEFKEAAGKVMVPKLYEWVPPSIIAPGYPKKNQIGIETSWKFNNGSEFEIMTNEQDTKAFEGWAGDWAHYDEPLDRDKYIATQRGLVDHNGRSWFTLTPLSAAWIYDELVLKADNRIIFYVEVDTEDNVGYGLTREGVDVFSSLLSDEEKDARLHGKYSHLSGLVYKEFDSNRHKVKPFVIPEHWPRIRLIDPHPRTPHAVMWMAVSPEERLYIYDELFKECLISELCLNIRAKSGDDNIQFTACDPIAFIQDPISGKSWSDEFVRNGIFVVPAVKDLAQGIQTVKSRFVGTCGTPDLYIFDTCSRTLWEIARYQWSENLGKSAQRRNAPQKPMDRDDHMMECMYRGVMMMPSYKNSVSYVSDIDYPMRDVP